MKWQAPLAVACICLSACSPKSSPPAPAAVDPAAPQAASGEVRGVAEKALANATSQGMARSEIGATKTATLSQAPPCSYLSADEISEILHGPIGKPAEKIADGISSCSYPPADMTSYQQAQIDLDWHSSHKPTLEHRLASTFGGSRAGRQVAHPVRLGDRASYSREGILHIYAGAAAITITLMMRPDSEAKAMAIGERLLKRMGYAEATPAAATSTPDARDSSASSARARTQNDELPQELMLGSECPEPDAPAKTANAQAAEDEKTALVPLKPGLTLAETWTGGTDDYDHECLIQILRVTDAYVDASLSCPLGKQHQNVTRQRRLCRQDMRASHFYHPSTVPDGPLVVSPATMFSLSSASLHDLKTGGKTRHRWISLNELWQKAWKPLDSDVDATLSVLKSAPRTFSIVVNDQPVDLPAITATSQHSSTQRADDGDDDADQSSIMERIQTLVLADGGPDSDKDTITATVLDDERFPFMLDYQIPGHRFRIRYTKISYESTHEMELKLATKEPVAVYGIYFDFASDTLRSESTPLLEEIAGILNSNLDWKLSITGHTDNVGGDPSNLELSKRRAAAVKTALVDRYHIVSARLSTDGVGAGQPQETNDTPEGRARNRRVVLRREH